MAEVRSILMALAALIVGLLVIAWAYGDFRGSKSPGQGTGQK